MKNAVCSLTKVVTFAVCLAVVGCDDGPTAPNNRAAPTPAVPHVAGDWHGTVQFGGVAALCGEDIPAAATFRQDGARVTGTVTMTQFGTATMSDFVGDLQGSQLTGTLTATGSPVSVGGMASSTHITLTYGEETIFCHKPVISLGR
jgi:hypothetical protein